MADWYRKVRKTWVGPLSAQDLLDLVSRNKLAPDDIIRKGRTGGEVPAKSVRGLFSTAGAAQAVRASCQGTPTAKRNESDPDNSTTDAVAPQAWRRPTGIGLALIPAACILFSRSDLPIFARICCAMGTVAVWAATFFIYKIWFALLAFILPALLAITCRPEAISFGALWGLLAMIVGFVCVKLSIRKRPVGPLTHPAYAGVYEVLAPLVLEDWAIKESEEFEKRLNS